jgi:hypothetical protein
MFYSSHYTKVNGVYKAVAYMGRYKYIQNLSFGNLNYKDLTADGKDELIPTQLLKKHRVHVTWYRVQVTAMNVLMNLQVLWGRRTSSDVLRLLTSHTLVMDHMHNQTRFRQHAFYPRPRDRGSSWLKYMYRKFILTSDLHVIHIETPFQPQRITSRSEYKCALTCDYTNPAFTCNNLPYLCNYLFATSLRTESLHWGQITERWNHDQQYGI